MQIEIRHACRLRFIIMPPEGAAYCSCRFICIVIPLPQNWIGRVRIVIHQKHTAGISRPQIVKRLVCKVICIRGSDAEAPGDDAETVAKLAEAEA